MVQTLQAGTLLLAYALLCYWCLFRHRSAVAGSVGSTRLLAYASQSGEARAVASRYAEVLERQGPVTLLSLNDVRTEHLQAAHLVLFFTSTYGEGEPPDNALRFSRRFLHADSTVDLSHLHTAVLAFGDSDYQHFCAFGLSLAADLQARGAQPMFDPVTVDRLDPVALAQWHAQLQSVSVIDDDEEMLQAEQTPALIFSLAERRCLNTGSPGSPVYHLRLRPESDADWQAGDIAELQLPGGELTREYSIASLPDSGALELVVRQVQKPDGSLGLGSGWLTSTLLENEQLSLRVRRNPAFHAPPADQPMILIGNGTGIAGLRAHLQQRVRSGATDNWLIFGERTQAHDRLFDSDLSQWQQQQFLPRLDRVYSRDGNDQRYVQDVLALHGEELLAWLARDAAIYICGSLEGMAPAVHRILLDMLGEQGLEDLTLAGRYRRDVY